MKRSRGEEDWLWRQPPVTRKPREAPARFAVGDALILAETARGGWAEGMPNRPWVVVACQCSLCARGSHVALDVRPSRAMVKLYPDAGPWRHVSASMLRKRGDVSRVQAEAWADVVAGPGFGQAYAHATEAGLGAAQTARSEFAALALFDSLGGRTLTAEQTRQFAWWREQSGGELTAEQLAQVRAWQRDRRPRG